MTRCYHTETLARFCDDPDPIGTTPGETCGRFRSRTFEGVAAACADQWGGWVEEQEGIGNGS